MTCALLQIQGVDIYVAKAYGSWQSTVLQYLQSKYDSESNSFPADTLGVPVADAVKAAGTAGDLNDKALMGQCIPFARLKHDEALQGGPEVSLPSAVLATKDATETCSALVDAAARCWTARAPNPLQSI